MKKFVYGSGFFLAVIIVGAGLSFSYRQGAAVSDGQEGTVQTAPVNAAGEDVPLLSQTLETETKAPIGYILKAENDRVVVYCADGITMFEYTDILVSELPDDLQCEIRNGKSISGTSQLYSFLENYSS